MKRKFRLSNSGEVMLEGMIVVIITIFVLLWLLGLGFIYYQRYTTTIVANDAAEKIASTYNNTNSDIIMGFVTSKALTERQLYRRFTQDLLHWVNEDRVSNFVKWKLDKSNFIGVVKDVDVEMSLVLDGTYRRHIELKTTCTYNTPFGFGLKLFGMEDKVTYTVTAAADCTDYADYIVTADYCDLWAKGVFLKGTGMVESIVKLMNSFIKVFNRISN